MNPLGKNISSGNQNNPINNIIQFMNSGGNPQQLFQTMIGNNEIATQLKGIIGNKNPKDVCMQLARNKGIDISQLEQLAQKLGAKR